MIGFFDSEDAMAPFDHRVLTAYRWPVDVLSERLARAGLTEVERVQTQLPERPDRRYAAIAARAVRGMDAGPEVTAGSEVRPGQEHGLRWDVDDDPAGAGPAEGAVR